MTDRYAVVDLFAGPGGLGEGFAGYQSGDGDRPFEIALSVENDPAAHTTLTLRSFLRRFQDGFPREYYDFLNGGEEPVWAELYPEEWAAAQDEVLCATLGGPQVKKAIDQRLASIRGRFAGRTIVIGGPPCQAYSVVGRVKNSSLDTYVAETDGRHFLYREYVRILDKLRPAVFVMENVKGLLSASVKGDRIIDLVMRDLGKVGGSSGYKLVPLCEGMDRTDAKRDPSDFLVKAEKFGVPQARHRVFIVGVRHDVLNGDGPEGLPSLASSVESATAGDVLRGMPRLRSGISRAQDGAEAWSAIIRRANEQLDLTSTSYGEKFAARLRDRLETVASNVASAAAFLPRTAGMPVGFGPGCPSGLRDFIKDNRLVRLANNETRSHREDDLARYLFASSFAEIAGFSPSSADFPGSLAPDHESWKTGNFSDRFRVQAWDRPASTVMSHISKDGHYYIHPDPTQCRSLTVREAARLQTFPDNYLFKGNRTEQYVQVGNAVPPFLARQIASAIADTLGLSEDANEHGNCSRSGGGQAVAGAL